MHLSIPFWSDFIVVRSYNKTRTASFQSHFGLILSHLALYRQRLKHLSFNPILVWFYLVWLLDKNSGKAVLSIPFWSDFIVPRSVGHFQDELTFNPILVWFYPSSIAFPPTGYFCLSIPFWSDFIFYINSKLFSPFYTFNPILVWFYPMTTTAPCVLNFCLSIPFWSDFIGSS